MPNLQEETTRFITWTKRLLGLIAFLLWGSVIFTLSQSPAPFIEQAPYCMAGTMLIFGLLTAVYKGLDHWSLEQRNR